MRTEVFTGTKAEIANSILRLHGEVREAIVVIDEPSSATPPMSQDDFFAEMDSFTVKAGGADYSRESIYEHADDE